MSVDIKLSHYWHDALFLSISFVFPLLRDCLLHFFDGHLSIAQRASLKRICDVSLEPIVNAARVKQMPTGGEFPHRDAPGEVFKANYAFVLLELIHLLFKTLLFD